MARPTETLEIKMERVDIPLTLRPGELHQPPPYRLARSMPSPPGG